jgi:hypothetical protein
MDEEVRTMQPDRKPIDIPVPRPRDVLDALDKAAKPERKQ